MHLTKNSFLLLLSNPLAHIDAQQELSAFTDTYPYCMPAWLALYRMLENTDAQYTTVLAQLAARNASGFLVHSPVFVKEQPVISQQATESDVEQANEPSDSKIEIIEKFILAEPRIVPKESDFTEAELLANRSNEDQLNFVSETLAEIYIAQGNKSKGIKIYEKLALKYPEKSAYFAALIENLK
jgi:hypothetical protein